jgi:hypothetical protein
MNCTEVPCRLYTLHADNGDPLLLYGEDEAGHVFLWPTPHIARHPIAFARWTHRNVKRWGGKSIHLQHELCEATRRWALWLGARIDNGVASL